MAPPSSPPLAAKGGRRSMHDRTSSASRLSQSRPADLNIPHDDTNRPLSNIFGDEFSLEPFGGQVSPGSTVSSDRHSLNNRSSVDGDRPAHTSPFGDSSEILPQEEDALPLKTDSQRYHEPSPSTTLPSEKTASGIGRAPSDASSVAHRSISTSSRFSIPRAMSPYRGQTGPSHPYAMYPQGTSVARSTSLASSTSTVRPVAADRSSQATPVPPQHPYAMYYQNTVPEEAVNDPQMQLPPVQAPTPTPPEQPPAIPVGFPGSEPTEYRGGSRSTPNEIGDIIGPDGHTEQLPPYTRYPETLPPKREPEPTIVTPQAVPPAVPDQVAEDPESRGSSHTLITQPEAGVAASHTDTSAESESNGSFKEMMALHSKRRVCCGIPIWMVIITASVLILGTVIGGVIGGVLGSKQGAKEAGAHETTTDLDDQPKATVTVTASAVLDATPLPSDPGPLPPAPTGTYIMPAHALSGQSNRCVNDTDYSHAWKCFTQGHFQYTIGMQGNAITLSLESFRLKSSFIYGGQKPVLHKTNHTMKLMQDKTNMSLGPAWFFFTDFDKLIIIAEENFPTINPAKRSVQEAEVFRRGLNPAVPGIAGPGHKPWFCWWNVTFLEAFVYINQTRPGYLNLEPSPTNGAIEDPETTSGVEETLDPPDAGLKDDMLYPYLVKIEEKRFVRHGPAPYCEQMQLMDDGTIAGPLDVPVVLEEMDTSSAPGVVDAFPQVFKREDEEAEAEVEHCFCQWFNS